MTDDCSSWYSFLCYHSELVIVEMIKYIMIITSLLLSGCAEQAAYLRGEQPTDQQLQANRDYLNYMAQQRQRNTYQPSYQPAPSSDTNCYISGNNVSCYTQPNAQVDTSMYRRY